MVDYNFTGEYKPYACEVYACDYEVWKAAEAWLRKGFIVRVTETIHDWHLDVYTTDILKPVTHER